MHHASVDHYGPADARGGVLGVAESARQESDGAQSGQQSGAGAARECAVGIQSVLRIYLFYCNHISANDFFLPEIQLSNYPPVLKYAESAFLSPHWIDLQWSPRFTGSQVLAQSPRWLHMAFGHSLI